MTFEEFFVRLLYPALVFILPSERWSAIYFATALLAAFYVYWRFAERGPDADATTAKQRGFLRFLFPKEIWTHPSARADYAFFVINKLLIIFVFGYFALGSETVAAWTGESLTRRFGESGEGWSSHWALSILTTLAVAAALDFGLWLSHYLFHKIPFLWEFHKVHHSAEVMTPFTAARVHPVEDVAAASLGALSAGLAYGAMGYWMGPAAHELTMFETNVVLIGFYFAAFVLRHSHVWLAYPVWLQHIFVSPAQHHIHHSADRAHWDKNMGFIFALWDWAAGTLIAPKEYQRITFGLGDRSGEEVAFRSVKGLYFRPFTNIEHKFLRPALARLSALFVAQHKDRQG
ncbi:MAG: sterol desaturase family protein [Neomegalonema sp.]|nr:sterol desaturase family protein [Neomegalonema sp.]